MTARTLVLMRHSKAEHPGELTDFERQLTDRGRRDAGAAGAWLAAEGLRPGLVLCSSATRTRQTWHGVAVALGRDDTSPAPEVRYEDGLYDGGRTEMIDLLRAVPDSIGTVLVVAHNPTVSDVSILLADGTTSLREGLATSGVAVHRAGGWWSTTEPGSMPLVTTHTARG
ncbi:SixA phosphatase family protein [Couchioplanes caeruleus]|uniref:Phosphohistidine phosphatase n=2 Tax=Couchioplanes caeruleus TaxID=56438 RepID=A0A1K0FJJ6_9ACTN|nr:histidine phosphatase family protein [Couchioplanes caeruleus]OJF13021.1 phosphohistidine phosphatase [Couchioplanes caeruleus subsp. caeruleus]ROP31035.1 phosphohistidine phosphatase [Couchioplanes caeruleus]